MPEKPACCGNDHQQNQHERLARGEYAERTEECDKREWQNDDVQKLQHGRQ